MKSMWNKPEGDNWRAYEASVGIANALWRNAAPLAFTWLEWSILLAAVQYAGLRTHLWPFTALTWVLGILLWGYFMALVRPAEAKWQSRKEMFSWPSLLTGGVALAATAGMVSASYWLAAQFLAHPL